MDFSITINEGVPYNFTTHRCNLLSHVLSGKSKITISNEMRDVYNVILKFKIDNFHSATEKVFLSHTEINKYFGVEFYASVFPNGVDEANEGWVIIRSGVNIYNAEKLIQAHNFNWTVSIIDIHGEFKFYKYFDSFDKDTLEGKYFEKSFIFDREDELLTEGALFLRLDMFYDSSIIKDFMYVDGKVTLNDSFAIFCRSIPRAVVNKGARTGNSSDTFTVFDFSYQVLTLSKFNEPRKIFGVYGITNELSLFSFENKKIISLKKRCKYIQKHIWIFDTCPDRFLLSLAPDSVNQRLLLLDSPPVKKRTENAVKEEQRSKLVKELPHVERHLENVGQLLLNSSPVIRKCVNAPMKEQQEKRIDLTHVESLTFQLVLHFLESGILPRYGFNAIVEVYKFAHMYEMEILQLKCAQLLVDLFETEAESEEIMRIAELYSDKYVLTLLESRTFNKPGRLLRLDSDCFC